jgi:Na+-driven multidrug efflux pump
MVRKPSQIIARFAILGMIVAVFFAAYQVTGDSASPAPIDRVSVLLFVLCPASLLSIPFAMKYFEAVEVGSAGFYIMWSVIALVNSGIYAMFGTWFAYSRNPNDDRKSDPP